MAFIALIKNNVVENVVVPPDGANPTVWFAPEGYLAIASETAGIGDVYDPETGNFTRPIDNQGV